MTQTIVPNSTAYNTNTNRTLTGEKLPSYTQPATTIPNSIKNPQNFYLQDGETYYNWCIGGSKYNLWDASSTTTGASDKVTIKSIYDPCPVGFKVPGGRCFTGFTTTGSNTSTANQFNVIGSFANGWIFKKNDLDSIGTFFPAAGCCLFAGRGVFRLTGCGSSFSTVLRSGLCLGFVQMLHRFLCRPSFLHHLLAT